MDSAQKKQPPTPAPNKPRASGWSAERRAKQAAAIRRWAPWGKSTGPRTASGKARAAQNAAKPWLKTDPLRIMDNALKTHKRYLIEINRLIEMRKNLPKNELLKAAYKNHEKAVCQLGRKAAIGLIVALTHLKLCKTLDFSRPMRQIVNASSAAPVRSG